MVRFWLVWILVWNLVCVWIHLRMEDLRLRFGIKVVKFGVVPSASWGV